MTRSFNELTRIIHCQLAGGSTPMKEAANENGFKPDSAVCR